MNTPVKLLYIIDSYRNPYAGTEGQLLKLINGLDKDRYQAGFVVFRNSEYLMNNTFPIPVDVLNVGRLASPASWARLYRFFSRKKAEGYRLAHIFFNDASIICPPILRLLGYRVIISRRDMGYWYSRLNRLALKLNSCLVDYVVANSRAVREITMQAEGYAPDRVKVIYNGYQEAAVASRADPDALGMKGNEFRIALVANIRPIKRMEDAIRAVARVRETVAGAVLYIVGDGDPSGLKALAGSLGLADAVRFTGPRDDILQLMPLFDVGILCSESEGFSNTLIEYMQSALPVVCSGVGGNPEIVEHGVNGFLYEVGDIGSLAAHIDTLAKDDALRMHMGMAGAGKVKQQYGLDGFVNHHQNLYRELAGR